MRQHITIEQLQELSDDEVCQLNTLMNHEWDLTEEEFQKYTWERVLKDTSEYCTIGRMIEILEKSSLFTQQIINEGGRYCVTINPKSGYTTTWETEYYNELCDALWEAVKKVLKEVID